jgi:hypothetical protein
LDKKLELFDNLLIMFDWIRRWQESPSEEALRKFSDDFLDDVEKKPALPSYWHIFPWSLVENEFTEFLEKLISGRTRLELEIHINQQVFRLKMNAEERDEHSKVAADTSLAEVERKLAQYQMERTKRQHERLTDRLLKIMMKQQVFEEISKRQEALAVLHPTVKTGSLVLADLPTVFNKLDEEMLPIGCEIFKPTKERITEIAREVRELRDKEVAHTSVVNR